jgi:hypothetical protein
MGGMIVHKGHTHHVRQVHIDKKKLEEIADLLGIPQAERERILEGAVSIHIFTGSPPSSSSGSGSTP